MSETSSSGRNPQLAEAVVDAAKQVQGAQQGQDALTSGKRKRGDTHPHMPGVKRLFKQHGSKSANTPDVLHALLAAVQNKIIGYTGQCTKGSTVQPQSVLRALSLLLTGDLATITLEYCDKALKAFEAGGKESRKHVRANIAISPCVSDHALRDAYPRVFSKAAIVLAAALDCIGHELLTAAKGVMDKPTQRITPRLLFLGIQSDQELHDLFIQRLGVVIPDSGVCPTFQQRTRKPFGRKIKQQQQETGHELQRAPVKRIIVATMKQQGIEGAVAADAVNALHVLIENTLVGWLAGANLLAQHSKRVLVSERDVTAYLAIKEGVIPPKAENVTVSMAGMRRLAYRAGVRSVCPAAIHLLVQYMAARVGSYIGTAKVLMARDDRRILTLRDVREALNTEGITLAM